METSGRAQSEKAMILIPAAVLFFMVLVITGGPTQFVRLLNNELIKVVSVLSNWVSRWV